MSMNYQMAELYEQGKSLREIARIYGFRHCHTVKNRLIRIGTPIRSFKEQMKITGLSSERNLKISKSKKGKKMSPEFGIKVSKAKKKFVFSKEFLINEYINKNKSCEQIASDCGCSRDTVRLELKKNNMKRKTPSDYEGYWKGKPNPSLINRNLTNNPSKMLHVRKQKSQLYKSNPKYQVNNKLKRDKMTYLEKKMIELLNELNFIEDVDFLYNKQIKVSNGFKFPDFRFRNKKIIIECDGSFWHRDKQKELERDKQLFEMGYQVFHFNEKQINDLLIPKLKEILQ